MNIEGKCEIFISKFDSILDIVFWSTSLPSTPGSSDFIYLDSMIRKV